MREITEKMHGEGKLKPAYSAHDLRHAFAVRVYQATHDIYAVKTALGHANVGGDRDVPAEPGAAGGVGKGRRQ